MIVLGTCNPPGEMQNYNGLYFKSSELDDIVTKKTLRGIPIKTEHQGSVVGKIESAFFGDDKKLQCLFTLDDSFYGSMAKGFVTDGIALDLSMGYAVDVCNSENKLKAGLKKTIEVSLVRKGARDGCHILGYDVGNGFTSQKSKIKGVNSSKKYDNMSYWNAFKLKKDDIFKK